MADDKELKDEPAKLLCSYCKKSTSKKYIKCDKCDKVYHSSCADRSMCCESKINKANTHEIGYNLQAYGEERKALQISNEQLKIENNILKEENQKLRNNIITLEEKIKNLLSENHKTCIISNVNKEDLQSLIKNELDNELLSVKKEIQTLKVKIQGLESTNKSNAAVEKTQDGKNKLTKNNLSIQTKQTKEIKPEDTKQLTQNSNIETLENRQKQIMNKIINLNTDGLGNDKSANTANAAIGGTSTSPSNAEAQTKITQLDTEGFTSVIHKRNTNFNRKRNTTIIGRANNRTNGKLQGAIRREWFYVGHIINKEATVEDMKSYLVENLENSEGSMFACMKLNTLGSCSAFKVGIPSKYVKLVQDPEFWSEGVVFKGYNFKKKINSAPSRNEDINFPKEGAANQKI